MKEVISIWTALDTLACHLSHEGGEMDLQNTNTVQFDPFSDDEEESSKPKKPAVTPSFGAAAIMTLIALFFGVSLGRSTVPQAPVKAEPVPTVTVTTTVTKTVTQPVPQIPARCQDAIDLMIEMQANLATVIGASGKQSDVVRDAYTSITLKDIAGLNRASQAQNDLVRSVSSARRGLQDQQLKLNEHVAACKIAFGR